MKPFEHRIGDWKLVRSFDFGDICIRHVTCSEIASGECACGTVGCQNCHTKPPNEMVGLKALLEWER